MSRSSTANVTVKNVNDAPVAAVIVTPGAAVSDGTAVTLDGPKSYDPDGDPIITYSWVQTGGPFNVTLTGVDTATAAFTPMLPGGVGGPYTFTFQLTVFDAVLSGTVSVEVTVEQVNHAPTANAGPTQTVNVGSLITLDGTGSADPDSDPHSYTATDQLGTPCSGFVTVGVAHDQGKGSTPIDSGGSYDSTKP